MKLPDNKDVLLREDTAEEGLLHASHGKIWYRVVGTDKIDSGKPPILCVHGGPGITHNYLTPMEMFADERPVILYDQLGCGDSDRLDKMGPTDDTEWNIDYFADEIDEIREAFGLNDFYFFGQSWGSLLGSYYLLEHSQEGIRGVIFSGPAISAPLLAKDCERLIAALPEEHQEAIRRAEETKNYDDAYMAANGEFSRRYICRLPKWPRYIIDGLKKNGENVYHTMWGQSEFFCTGNLRDYDATERLHEIHLPVLFVCGEYDECTPEATKTYCDALPGAKMAVMPGCSHMHHAEDPEGFRKILDEFILPLD